MKIKKRNILLALIFSVFTYGIYYIYWRISLGKTADCLGIKRKFVFAILMQYKINLIIDSQASASVAKVPEKAPAAEKGSAVRKLSGDFVVVDVETTGLYHQSDEVIEFGALRVRGWEAVDSFQTLVHSDVRLPKKVTSLTGITQEMVDGASLPSAVVPAFAEFIGDDVIVGHNVSFDREFINDAFEKHLRRSLSNDYFDTLKLSQKVLPELEHHRLGDIVEHFGIAATGAHRSLADCQSTFSCLVELNKLAGPEPKKRNFDPEVLKKRVDMKEIVAETTDFDENHPLFGKHVVFTGDLEELSRADAAQKVVNVGGICDNNVTKKLDVLIVGTDGEGTGKHVKATEYRDAGCDITFMTEEEFLALVE